jgi:hypothetical protein
MNEDFTHIDEFLQGLSPEELNYICEKAETMKGEVESEETPVELNEFEEAMKEPV